MSIREAIIQEIQAAIDAPEKPAGLNVHRARTRPIHQDALPAAVPYLAGEDIDEEASTKDGMVVRSLEIRVEIRVQNEVPDAALDPLVTWVVQQVLADSSLGGRTLGVYETGTSWAAEELNAPFGAAAVGFLVEYMTAEADPTTQELT